MLRMLRGARRSTWVAMLLLAGFAATPSGAGATPSTYFFDAGTVTITVTTGTTTLATRPNQPLNGGQMTFDPNVVLPGDALTDFQLMTGALPSFTLSQPYGGRDSVTIHSISITPTPGYVSNVALNLAGPPVDNYTLVSAGPLHVVVNFSSFNSLGPPPPPITGNVYSFNLPAASGKLFNNATTGVGNIALFGVTLGVIGPFGGETAPLVVSGNYFFRGLVPEPHTAALVGFGLLGLVAMGRRMKR